MTEVLEVENLEGSDEEREDTSGQPESAAEKPAKKVKEPARGDLPDGYVTPVGLAKILTERKLHTDRDNKVVEVKPQMVYSYIKNAPKDHPFPMETVKDSIGVDRFAVKIDAAIKWWTEKNERVAERKANATAKEAKKAEKAAKHEAGETAADQTPVAEEAE
jgi:hypothetical protein